MGKYQPRLQIVGVLSDPSALNVHRLICLLPIQGEIRQYYVYVERSTALQVERILEQRPFRALRLDPRLGAALVYVGHRVESGDPMRPDHAPRIVLYLEQQYGRSRRKYRVEISSPVMRQLRFLLHLTEHDGRVSIPLLEA